MNQKHAICVIGGDGIGPEVVGEAVRVLKATTRSFEFTQAAAGYGAYKKYGTPLPSETVETAKKSDAVLFGAVTTPPNIDGYRSPIVALRKELSLFANVRPFEPMPGVAALKPLDIVLVRENTEDLYTGREHEIEDGFMAERIITGRASTRIIRFAFNLAQTKKRRKVTLVHKANVLRKSDGLFLSIGQKIAKEFPKIEFTDMLVDSCAMQLIKAPEQFDVIVTTNMFGDILSDEIAALNGGLGVAPSANIGQNHAVFEPVHGSAPKHAGQNRANPMASILSACLLLEYVEEFEAAQKIRLALRKTLESGIKTSDLGGPASMSAFTDGVIANI